MCGCTPPSPASLRATTATATTESTTEPRPCPRRPGAAHEATTYDANNSHDARAEPTARAPAHSHDHDSHGGAQPTTEPRPSDEHHTATRLRRQADHGAKAAAPATRSRPRVEPRGVSYGAKPWRECMRSHAPGDHDSLDTRRPRSHGSTTATATS